MGSEGLCINPESDHSVSQSVLRAQILHSHNKLYIHFPIFLGKRKQSCSGVIHFGECALNQSSWQLKGGKVGCNARNILSKEREITQAEVAVTKKAAGNALCSRESVSAAKKKRESGREDFGEK